MSLTRVGVAKTESDIVAISMADSSISYSSLSFSLPPAQIELTNNPNSKD